jgi:hypothetical protein
MAVSSLVPASAGITVADGNAAGWGSNAWVQLGTANSATGTVTYTFTGLSGYRKLRLGVTGVESAGTGGIVRLIFNSDTGSNYAWSNVLMQNGQTAPFRTLVRAAEPEIVLSAIQVSGHQFQTVVEIDNVAGTHKPVVYKTRVTGEDYFWGAQPTAIDGFATWRNTTAINQIDFIMPSQNGSAGRLYVWGQV